MILWAGSSCSEPLSADEATLCPSTHTLRALEKRVSFGPSHPLHLQLVILSPTHSVIFTPMISMWFLRSNRNEKVPPFQQFQDCGGTGVASSKLVLLLLCLFLRCPPGQEACLGCILNSSAGLCRGYRHGAATGRSESESAPEEPLSRALRGPVSVDRAGRFWIHIISQ